MSIFCSRERWHILLRAIGKRLAAFQKDGLALEKKLVYLSEHRGSSIRLALYFSQVTEDDCRAIGQSIYELLAENPSPAWAGGMPTRSFFMDFPTDQVKYNLFDERCILPPGLEHLQRLLSSILCEFFEDHPVDDEGIFTLLNYLQREILEHAFDTPGERMKFCSHIINELSTADSDIPEGKPARGAFRQPAAFQESAADDVFDLLARFGEAGAALCRSDADAVKAYLTLLHLIQLHLFKIPRQEFLASLHELPVFF